jgi:hypothetical protein
MLFEVAATMVCDLCDVDFFVSVFDCYARMTNNVLISSGFPGGHCFVVCFDSEFLI